MTSRGDRVQVEPLVDYAARHGRDIEPYLKYAVMQHPGMWLPITSRHRIHTVEGWLGAPPIGYRWGTRIKGGVVEARAEAVSVKRPAPQGSGYLRFPVEDWEEDPYAALQQDAEQYPVYYQDGLPMQAGSEHDPRL